MLKLYKIYDELGIVRVLNNKEEATAFLKLDKSFRVETVKVEKVKKDTNKFTWAYKILGDSILWDATAVIKC